MKMVQRGFTLIDVMITVAIIGILASMAIPAFQSYTVRAQVAEGLNLSGPLKNAVAEYFVSNGAFPSDNTEAGANDAGEYSGKYVDSISVSDADISIRYGNDASAVISGYTVVLTAVGDAGSVSWSCASGGDIPDVYLPSVCR